MRPDPSFRLLAPDHSRLSPNLTHDLKSIALNISGYAFPRQFQGLLELRCGGRLVSPIWLNRPTCQQVVQKYTQSEMACAVTELLDYGL